MPRRKRIDVLGMPQHVVQRGNNRQVTFYGADDYLFYLECLQEAAEKQECDVYAYVLMTNHVHLLIAPYKAMGISKMMQSIGRRYVQYINQTYARTGTLWEGRYKASLVQSEGYLLTCMRYIELNPVRARMVAHPAEYKWSSYRSHAQGEVNRLLTEHALYRALGLNDECRQAAYRDLFAAHMEPGLVKEIRYCLAQGCVLGNERFREKIEAALKIKARPVKQGRPRKNGKIDKVLYEERGKCV